MQKYENPTPSERGMFWMFPFPAEGKQVLREVASLSF